MNRNFEFKQLLRAYRTGIIDEATFEQEMKYLENGAHSSNGAGSGAFKAFGKSYDSERAAVVGFLEAVSAAETNGGETVRAWLEVCTTDCIRGGLKMVAEREAYHGRAFTQRLAELGGTMPDRMTAWDWGITSSFAPGRLKSLAHQTIQRDGKGGQRFRQRPNRGAGGRMGSRAPG